MSGSKLTELKNERDYAIRKGKVLERFNELFWERYKHDGLFNNVYQLLIRDADPYDIIEKLIEINAKAYEKINELANLIPVKKFNHE